MNLIQGLFTKRAVMVGLIAGSSILAASSFAMPAGGCGAKHGQRDPARMEAHFARHQADLKEKLKLMPEQEAAWNTFSSTAQVGMQHKGVDGKTMRGEFKKLNTPQRLDKMQAMADQRRAKMALRAEAIKTFYAQLSPEQQGVFDAEAMPSRHRGHRHHS